MANRPDLDDDDDDFSEIYKAYTGPGGGTSAAPADSTQERANTNTTSKRPLLADSEEEKEEHDPNAVPTDFTSREAKLWEAKSKATERNWKKRKEEEMICKICGESGHYTQGCPSTLGANGRSQDLFERVAARDKTVRALFTQEVVGKIEKDTGCRIRMDTKFLFVHGKDGLILSKGVDAVHKLINEEANNKSPTGSHTERYRSPERITAGPRVGRSEAQRANSSPRNTSEPPQRFGRHDRRVEGHGREDLHKSSRNSPQRFGRPDRSAEDRIREDLQESSRNTPQRFGRLDRSVEDRVHEDLYKPSRVSPQARAHGNDGARGRSSRSKSPARHPYTGNSYSSYDSHRHSMGSHRSDRWNNERRGSEVPADSLLERFSFPQSLEEVEMEYKREAMDLGKIRDQQEDEENQKHREAVRELRENHMKRVALLQGSHAKQWEEFLQTDAQRRLQPAAHQYTATLEYSGGYKHAAYTNYDNMIPRYSDGANHPTDSRAGYSDGANHLMDSRAGYSDGANHPMDSRAGYPDPVENFSHQRPRDVYGNYTHQRPAEDYGRSYTRY